MPSEPTPPFSTRLRQAGVAELPVPDSEALAHSERLQGRIREQIRASGGHIRFRDFMELALYAPGLGYYSAGSHKLGAGGDFITAPETSPLFSRTLARAIAPLLMDGEPILEVGAGSGVMAADMLEELARLDTLPGQYRILERSADLQQRQRQTLAEKSPAQLVRVDWLTDLPVDFQGVVVANELIDALPVHRVVWLDEGDFELLVGEENGQFVWKTTKVTEPRLQARMTAIRELNGGMPDGYVSEINLAGEDWLQTLASRMQRGVILLIDYGYPQATYYHPQRKQGTLTCHYRHQVHDDPFRHVGLQDITAHVDFTALADAALAAGLKVAGYTTQAHFLLGSGLTELAGQTGNDDPAGQLDTANQIRRLTLPGEMGETFKVMALSKARALLMPGLQLRDLRDRL